MAEKKNRSDDVLSAGIGRGHGRGFGAPPGIMPVVKAKDVKFTIKRLWKLFRRERKLLIGVFLLVLAGAAVSLSGPMLIGQAIKAMSGGIGKVEFAVLGSLTAALLFIYLFDTLGSFMQGWIMAGISQRIVKHLRKELFSKLQTLPVAFFDVRTHGELMSRLTNDVENISSTISQATIQLLTSIVMILGSFTAMLIMSPLMTLAAVVTIPLILLVTRTIAGRTKKLFKEQQVILGQLNGNIEETISGIQVVKAFNHEQKVIDQFEVLNSRLCETGTRAQIWSGFMMPIMNVINNLSFTIVAGAGGILAVNGMVSVGTIASFVIYSRQFTRPLNDVANIFNILQSALAGAERVFEVLDEREEIPDASDAIALEKTEGHVVFENVDFGYRKDVKVLKNISFEVPSGSSIALVGPTGAGKTTIVNLLARFYDVTGGIIKIDGIDIRNYTRDSLRQCFGIVLQDTYLFSGTIKENIRYGRLDATDKEVEEAAEMANADIFIRRLSKGYDTELSESGSNLSQGQRQLLAIARAVLSNPSILILDEATSSVDTRTELHIQEAMLKLMKGRTTFLIAHRLSTIRDADLIMVIDGGEIREKGSHYELMSEDGVYRKMVLSQLQAIEA